MPNMNLKKLWKKGSVTITEYDPTHKVVYLGNVLTVWARGDGCVDKPLATLWRNYCQSNRPDIAMKVTICNAGLRAVTREHGLTEYWAHRVTHCAAHPAYPRVFCWVYRHEGRRLKQELRCHAVLCPKREKAEAMATQLRSRLAAALHEFRREKVVRQNARLSLLHAIYDSAALPRRKLLLSTGSSNYRPPLERSKSAPKLGAIEESLEEEEEQQQQRLEQALSRNQQPLQERVEEQDEDEVKDDKQPQVEGLRRQISPSHAGSAISLSTPTITPPSAMPKDTSGSLSDVVAVLESAAASGTGWGLADCLVYKQSSSRYKQSASRYKQSASVDFDSDTEEDVCVNRLGLEHSEDADSLLYCPIPNVETPLGPAPRRHTHPTLPDPSASSDDIMLLTSLAEDLVLDHDLTRSSGPGEESLTSDQPESLGSQCDSCSSSSCGACSDPSEVTSDTPPRPSLRRHHHHHHHHHHHILRDDDDDVNEDVRSDSGKELLVLDGVVARNKAGLQDEADNISEESGYSEDKESLHQVEAARM